MKKYVLVLFHEDVKPSLQKIRDLGMVHINERKEIESEILTQDIQYADKINSAIKFLSKRETGRKADKQLEKLPGEELIALYDQKQSEYEALKQKTQQIEKEIIYLEPWGDFSGELIEKLKKEDLHIYFYIVPEKKVDHQWKEKFNYFEIAKSGTDIYFVIATKDEDKPDIPVDTVPVPEKGLSELQNERDMLDGKIQEIERFFDQAANYTEQLQQELDKINNRIVFCKKEHSVDHELEGHVVLVSGWIPKEKESLLENFLHENNIYFIKQEQVDDIKDVPVALKNNRFASLFEDVGKLFSLPGYKELDMTPFFAPFFAMFFGFCLGDAGYGLLFIILAAFLKRKMPQWKHIFSLVQVFGATTIFFGIISGTFWGIRLLDVDILEPYKGIILSDEQLFNLALIIGVFQILFGMILKVVNRYIQLGWKYSLSTVGWIILLVWLLVRHFGIEQPESYLLLHRVLLSVSLFLIFFFANPAVNIFMNIGLGLWDVYLMITGLLGDVLSYIRLFALGISSAILGLVFNEIALTTLSTPVLGPLFFLIIFVFGHGINLFMASLGAFIHPMRLTFVEFYKNAGFSGGGKQYTPFKEVRSS